jgi:ABC-type glycerol-3-phosphate transport system permease component
VEEEGSWVASVAVGVDARVVAAGRNRGRGKHRRGTIRESRGDRVTLWCIYAVLTLIVVIIVFPLLYILAASFSSGTAVTEGKVWLWPVHPTLEGYIAVFNYPGVWQAYVNSIIYTVTGTVLSVTLSVLCAWPLSRPQLYGKQVFTWLLLIAFLFPAGIVPLYLVVKDLGMLNTRLSLIITPAFSIFAVFIARSFFRSTVPNELVEAAECDGASEFTVLRRIVLPMSKPVLAVLALLYAVAQWNSYFYALIFLSSEDLWPLQLVLRQVLVLNQLSASSISNLSPEQLSQFQNLETILEYSLIVLGSLPVLVLYPLAQRYFVKGFRLGSLKG